MSRLFKKYFDISKLVIWGEGGPEGDNTKRPRLVISFRDGNPRFVVFTGLQGREGVIACPFDAIHMATAMNLFKDIIKGEPDNQIRVESLAPIYENNKPTNEKTVKATLYAGKSKDGILYFSVIAEGRPKIVFPIKPSPFHIFRDGNKNVIPDRVISEKMAMSIADMILDIIAINMINYTNEEYDNGRKQISTETQNSISVKAADLDHAIIKELDDLIP